MKIYTRKGDKGKTGLFNGDRVYKDNIRIECNGELDEVNSNIGLLRAKLPQNHAWQKELQSIQTEIMNLMSTIANPKQTGSKEQPDSTRKAEGLEQWMEVIQQKLGNKMNELILPGGNEVSAMCHIIRTKIRSAERKVISLHRQSPLSEGLIAYINRLSDLFFMLALEEMKNNDIEKDKYI